MIAIRVLRVLAVLVVGLFLSAGAAQAGVLTTVGFGSDGLDIDTARLPNSGDYCSDPLGINRPCFSDKTLPFTGHGVIEHTSLTATLSNTFSLGELSLYLSHGGVTVDLFAGLSHGGDLGMPVTITFDDLAAGPLPLPVASGMFRPDSPLLAFNGLEASGDWTLTIGDWDTGDISRYTGAVLAVTTPEPATLVLFALGLAGLGISRRRKL